MARTFAFDEDMDHIWALCRDLVISYQKATNCAATLVKPWHLALQLLFGDISTEMDPRLYTDEPLLSVSQTLEIPLFWTAISQASTIHNQLDEHLSSLIGKARDARYLQQLIGQAFWRKVEDESIRAEPAAHTGDEEDHILSHATRDAEEVLKRARKISEDYGSNYIASQHVLLSLLQDDALRRVLKQWETLNVDGLPDAVRKLRPMKVPVHKRPRLFPFLNDFAIDLTQTILDKKKNSQPIDPLIGRTVELRRLITILSRYKKNSAVLLGDPGVGKTAIAEALANRIVNSEVPESVVARVFSLNLTSILATPQGKLAYEEIITGILKEVADLDMMGTRAILFFDNLSQITLGGYRKDGSGLDAASIMKRPLAQGTLRCVGCSTEEDYRDHIEKDGALARRFSLVFICEPTPEQATEVLRGLKSSMERFHNVRITDGAVKSATSIAARYFAHKKLPDAALDLIDEACVSVSLSRFRSSEETWKLQRRRVVMEMEIRSLERQLDKENERLLKDMRYKLSRLDDKIENSTSLRRYRRRLCQDLKINDERMATTLLKLQTSCKAAKAQLFSEIKDLDMKGQELRRMLASGEMTKIPDEFENVHDVDPVTVKEVATTASYYAFIPAAECCDIGDMVNLEAILASVVVGQPKAIDVVSGVMRSLWAGLKNPYRPIASILFGGPSGTGKTLLVKELASIAAQQSGSLVTINANDYTLPETITRLIGTPTYTGFNRGDQLTECVRRKPFSVVYIKEIERGCAEFRMLIQRILDEGIVRDGDGNLINFTNCVIILTMALGRENLPHSRTEAHQCRHFEKEIHRHLPGEFLTRIDNIVIFRPVTGATLMLIINARLEELRRRLAVIDLKLTISDRAQGHILALLVQERVRTAERIDRWVRSQVIQPLTTLLLTTDVPENAVVALDVDEFDRPIVELQEGQPSRSSSPTSSYYSLGSIDTSYYSLGSIDRDATFSDTESVSSESESDFEPSLVQYDPISVVRSGLGVQPQRLF
ncbi:P-loop containing nucleoside triphosphate hydrolase protein [Imleria badia]|nr:P-loop containing nucleoside triphosphate hydrolase protein [Imleria badia]